ncbi:adenosine receptor A2a-like [Porites lutea]|uniref:adenosine receptor A2a-like n=1 Tax=Porites lutea TaxID=51062 RepID=UPI003CC6518D
MRDFTPSLVLNCVVNSFLSYATVMLNIVLIFALRRTSSLPKTLKALILSVAVSDIGMGILVQPLYTARLVMKMKMKNTNSQETYNEIVNVIGRTLANVSFFGVTTISVDRFLAIHLHLKHQDLLTYQEIVTYKRIVATVILSWLLGASLALTGVLSHENVFNLAGVTVVLVCLLTMGLIYFKIYIAVRRHTVQVHAQPAQAVAPNEENRSIFERVRKTAVGTFYVYLLFLACHLPSAIVILTGQKTNKKRRHFKIYAETLLYLSSSLVPLVYCWKFRHIRCAFKNILRNIFASQNQIQEG